MTLIHRTNHNSINRISIWRCHRYSDRIRGLDRELHRRRSLGRNVQMLDQRTVVVRRYSSTRIRACVSTGIRARSNKVVSI